MTANGWQLYEVKVATTKLQYLQELSATFILYRCCYVSGLNKKKKGGEMFLKNFILKCFNYENRNER